MDFEARDYFAKQTLFISGCVVISESDDSHALGMIIVGIISKYIRVVLFCLLLGLSDNLRITISAGAGRVRHDQGGEVSAEKAGCFPACGAESPWKSLRGANRGGRG